MPKPPALLPALTLIALLSACASQSTPSTSVTVTRQIQLPPLPDSARASQVPAPSICSPTCSAGAATILSQSADMLTTLPPPD